MAGAPCPMHRVGYLNFCHAFSYNQCFAFTQAYACETGKTWNYTEGEFRGKTCLETAGVLVHDVRRNTAISDPMHLDTIHGIVLYSVCTTRTPPEQVLQGQTDDSGKFMNSPFRSKKVAVPPNAISRVIGRGGSNINTIRAATGAHIEVEKQTRENLLRETRDDDDHGDEEDRQIYTVLSSSDDSDGDTIRRWVPLRSAKRRLSYDLDDDDGDDDGAGTSVPRSCQRVSGPSALVPYTDEDTATSACATSVTATERLNDGHQVEILSGFTMLESSGEDVKASNRTFIGRSYPRGDLVRVIHRNYDVLNEAVQCAIDARSVSESSDEDDEDLPIAQLQQQQRQPLQTMLSVQQYKTFTCGQSQRPSVLIIRSSIAPE
ncbi:hypothetical protein TSAR_012292 [Trichomalopsis sarcophagae]|uniref:K Homology domain-containing protein n=1 Tax=Trichomalopsis sarcophagae TaxID=543379 RepID=A0A232FNL6_9HYME|nr:hypothetical protein TSAR_012292 [Trichomalopsis sarcophagae]